MEKISKIIAGTPRVTSLDMSKERPVRPGAPSFGAPVVESDLATRYKGLSAVDNLAQSGFTNYGQEALLNEKKQVQIVKDLETKFFTKPSDSKDPVIAPKGSFIPEPEVADSGPQPSEMDVPVAAPRAPTSINIYA